MTKNKKSFFDSGLLQLEVQTLSCAITKLIYNQEDVFLPKPYCAAEIGKVPHFGSFPMIPFANRIEKGKLSVSLNDNSDCHITHQFPINLKEEGLAIHGLSWQKNWQVSDQTKNSITLFNLVEDFDYVYRGEVCYELNKAELTIKVMVENLANLSLPFGLGLHPWFCLNKSCLVEFGKELSLANYSVFPKSKKYYTLKQIDKVFTPDNHNLLDGCFMNAGGKTKITNKQDGYRCLINFGLENYLHIFVNKEINAFCLEPVTHLPGKLGANSNDWLEPNQTKSLEMTLNFEKL